ncbi:MAG: hypothetical protein J2P37_25765, partial [Ktedonobacteraceae bacterium]|nr:hypothetical protein [Ktedonobacteraceae bacterium]
MTKEFNRQRSNGPRPPLRHTSSNRYEGSSPRSARLRLSRDVVDRAWENGAQNRHADYHPRPNHKNSPANGRNSQHGGYQQRNRFGNNQGGQPDTSSQQPFEPGKRRYNRGTPGTQNDGRYRAPARGNYRSDFVDRDRPPYDRPTGEHRGRPPYDRSAGEQRGYNPYRRENRRYRDHGSYQERAPRRAYAAEQYEGDYEQFNYSEDAPPSYRQNRGKPPVYRSTPPEEYHVTRLPDGR